MPFYRQSKWLIYYFLLSAISNSVSASTSAPVHLGTCPVPSYINVKTKTMPLEEGLVITSDRATIEKNMVAKFTGNVSLNTTDQSIKAQSLIINRKTGSLNASGKIHFQTTAINVFSEDLIVSQAQKATELLNNQYQFNNSLGHGTADKITLNANGFISLVDSNFTTCYGETPDWQLVASEINISTDDNFGEAYHARLELFEVPVFYIPYLNFPVTNERKSGFLYPEFSNSSRLGTQLKTPFYWNISENMDATITPRYMSKHGTQLITEFRYLTGLQNGSVDLEYLDSDDAFDSDESRYLARIQHAGTFADNYRIYIDTTSISDDNYLIDIGSKHYSSNDAYLYQTGEIAYFGEDWDLTAKIQNFEILGNHRSSYKTLPQLEFNNKTLLGLLGSSFNIHSEFSKFENRDENLPHADRYHVEAGLLFPVSTPGWYINSELKLLQTHYQQKKLADDSILEKTVDRTLPKFRLHGGLNLDKNLSQNGFTQTIEPQIQYLYIPNKDQSTIGLYDTAPLQDDYNGLFRDQRFSGLDRIAEANQYSWGVTSRILDQKNDELFRLSLGRIVYLNNSNIATVYDENATSDKSALVAETFFKMNNQWQLSGDIQYNTKENTTNNSQVRLDFHHGKKYSGQLNHRYVRDVSGVRLEQMSLLGNVAVNQDWKVVGSLTQDLQVSRSIETYAGVQYESCCWALRFSYHRNIDSRPDDNIPENENRGEFNSGFMLQFVIKGLGGENSPLSSEDMLNSSIFGYKRPYFLNN